MAENKSQHFVPRFYLENFSFDGGARFHLFRLAKQEVRRNVGIRDQCAANYFYGKDLKIEKTFMKFEGAVSAALRQILSDAKMPEPGSAGDLIFRTHVALQWGRTRAHINEQHEGTRRTVETAFAGNKGGKTQFENKIEATTLEDSMRMSIGTCADLAAFIGDLGSKLIDANGHGEFVASDTPVVQTNPYYLGRFPGSVTGFGVEGLVILLPLSPRYLAIYYDKACYRVGSPHLRTIPLASVEDLTALNNFQCLNADAVVYFQNEAFGPKLAAAYQKVKGLRPIERHGARRAFATGPGGPVEIVHSYRIDVNYRPALEFFSILRKRKGPRKDVGQVPDRQEELHEMYREYMEEVHRGRRQKSFIRYVVEQSGELVAPGTPGPPNGVNTTIRALEALVKIGEVE